METSKKVTLREKKRKCEKAKQTETTIANVGDGVQ